MLNAFASFWEVWPFLLSPVTHYHKTRDWQPVKNCKNQILTQNTHWSQNCLCTQKHKFLFLLGSFYFCCLVAVNTPCIPLAEASIQKQPSYSWRPMASNTLLVQSIINGRYCLGLVSTPLQWTIHLRGRIPAGCAEQTVFTFLLRLMEVWPEERLLDSALCLAWWQWISLI